jgi:hypothetical protein
MEREVVEKWSKETAGNMKRRRRGIMSQRMKEIAISIRHTARIVSKML